jgi:uncharacterized protein YfiM (DUF2279 family)
MKKVLFFISLIVCLNTTGQNMSNKDFWQKDKIYHGITVFSISTVTYAYLSIHKKHKNLSDFKKRLISFSTGMLVGILEEVRDSMEPNNHPCWGDLKADMTGALTFQVAVTIPLNFNSKKIKYKRFHKKFINIVKR